MSSSADALYAQRNESAQQAYNKHVQSTAEVRLCDPDQGADILACQRVRELLQEVFGISQKSEIGDIGLELMGVNKPEWGTKIVNLVDLMERIWDAAEGKGAEVFADGKEKGARKPPLIDIRQLCWHVEGLQWGERAEALKTMRGRIDAVMQAPDIQERYKQEAHKKGLAQWDQDFGDTLRQLRQAEAAGRGGVANKRGAPVSQQKGKAPPAFKRTYERV